MAARGKETSTPCGVVLDVVSGQCIDNLPRKFFGCRCYDGRRLAKVCELAERITLRVEHASAGLAQNRGGG
jgi:hypothetical protein